MSDVKEKRLIDANELLAKHTCDVYGAYDQSHMVQAVFVPYIKGAPTVDAVEVVRCAECKYSFQTEDGMVRCSFHSERNDFDDRGSSYNVWMEPTDFCSYGERRIDE